MPRQPDLDRPVKITLTFPTSWYSRLQLLLFSELEGRVPKGKYQEFFLARMRDFFDTEELDLAPYITGIAPGTRVIRGTPETIRALKVRLELEVVWPRA